ncbi:MAG: SIR2 family protein, partial [Pseudomonadota bacterium]
MFEFPDALFDRLRMGNVVLCTGVRFASMSGLAGWPDLLKEMADKVGKDAEPLKELIDVGNLLTVIGCLKRKLGNDLVADVLRNAYQKNGKLPKTHELLSDIPFHAAMNTGYDSLLERTLKHNGSAPKVYQYTDGAILRLSDDLKHFVVKAHGDFSQPEKLVLSRLDYKRFIGPNQAYRAFVEDLYRTHTLLLVGYRADDPDFVLFLDRLVATFGDAVSDHYAILPGLSKPEQDEFYANYRVRVVPYEEGNDPLAALMQVLSEFKEGWKAKGAEVAELHDPVHWLKQQLAAVSTRIDVVAGEGLSLSESRLQRIGEVAGSAELRQLDPDSLCRLGNVRLYLGDIPGALECYKAALDQKPDMAVAYLNLHHAKAEAKDYALALEYLQKAVELDESLRVLPKRYEPEAAIGRGTTGTVYRARDTQKNRIVTVKALRTSFIREHLSPERWLKEIEVCKELNHPNIARVYDALIEAGRCILVTEDLQGQSLERLIKEEGALTPERAVEILRAVCDGLAYSHEKGILHLDVMPSNIFLRNDGSVVLMDFRTGRSRKGRHVTVKKGSEGFQAPELLAGAGGDVRSDIYSLGATLYFMLTKQVPMGSFQRLREMKTAARRFDRLVVRSLQAVPDERPQTVAEFAEILAGSTEDLVLPDTENDLDGWLEVLTHQPDNEKALEVLGNLEAQFREEQDWGKLVHLLLGRGEAEPESGRRISMLREVARIYETEEGDLSKAFAALQAAFREDVANVEIRQDLERLAGATGMWNEVLQEYTNVAQRQRDPKVACDWWVRLGRLYSNELGHDDYAAASLGQALALDSNRMDALAELAEVAHRKGDFKEYAKTLGRQAGLEENSARKIELLKKLARTYLKELGDNDEAGKAYSKVLDVDPKDTESITALRQQYQNAEKWD